MKTQACCLLSLTLVALASCSESSSDTTALKSQVTALETRVAELETRLAALEPQVTASTTTLSDASAALSWAQDVQQYVTVDSRGDVVVAGANLRVQNVTGETPPASPTVNGKGNIIVGFDDERREGSCSGGANNGLACDPDRASDCPDGACASPQVVSEKTGSHNVVVGPKHTYSSGYSVLVGSANRATANGSFLAGAGNSVASASGSVLGGTNNSIGVASIGGAICGGRSNSATDIYAVVLGGQSNTASTPYAIVP